MVLHALTLAYRSAVPAAHAQSFIALAQPQHRVARIPTITPNGDAAGHRCNPNRRQAAATDVGRITTQTSEPLSGLQLRLSRQRRRMPGSAGSRPMAAVAAADRRARERTAARAATSCRPRSTRARSPSEIVAEIDGALSDAQADELARRHGLARIGSQNFPLIGATIGLFRITDRRSVETVQPRIRRRCQRSFGAAEFPLCAAGTEDGAGRGRSGAICACQAPVARGAYAGPRRQCQDRRDRFRHRRQASGTCRLDRRHLRCARQQGRPACSRHRHRRRDRLACAADGRGAGGAAFWRSAPSAQRRTARKAIPS